MTWAPSSFFLKCGSYVREEVTESLHLLLNSMGGMGRFVMPGEKVLLKPNLLSASPPERCVTTHPEVVRAAALEVIKAGGEPFIADSPGLDGFRAVAEKTAMARVARELEIPCLELDDPSPLPMKKNSVYQRVEVSGKALAAHKIINLPKLKTHGQMLLTLGVKNLFGTVVRQRKAAWHYTVGLNRDVFAELHLDIAAALAPVLTIMDGVEGMEGRGPGNGSPRFFGFLAAGTDPLAMDLQICSLLGADLESFPLYRAAKKRDLLPPGWEEWEGDPGPGFKFDEVDIPRLDSLHLLPRFLDTFGKRYLSSRPVQRPEACIGCGKCVKICPAGAMEMKEGRVVAIDYEKCIRCYCCQEVCPVDAIDLTRGALLRLLHFMGR